MNAQHAIHVLRDAGWSDAAIAHQIGCSQPTITRIRNGKTDPRESIARALEKLSASAVAEARQQRQRARWTVTLGTDPALRQQRLTEAVQAKRLSRDQVTALLPGPTPASLDQVAGLLEGPNATPGESHTAERFRALANLLRASSAASEQRRAEERQRRRDQENERKREIQRLIDQHDTSQRQDAA